MTDYNGLKKSIMKYHKENTVYVRIAMNREEKKCWQEIADDEGLPLATLIRKIFSEYALEKYNRPLPTKEEWEMMDRKNFKNLGSRTITSSKILKANKKKRKNADVGFEDYYNIDDTLIFGDSKKGQVSLSMSYVKSCRNHSSVVIGKTGSGKTHNFVKTNILQENGSCVITECKDELSSCFSSYLIERGYDVQRFDADNPEKSNRFNPFTLLEKLEGTDKSIAVQRFVTNLIGKKSFYDDPFHPIIYTPFIKCLVLYIILNDEIKTKDFRVFLNLLDKAIYEKGKTSTPLDEEIKKWIETNSCNANKEKYTDIYTEISDCYDAYKTYPFEEQEKIITKVVEYYKEIFTEDILILTSTDTECPDNNINLKRIGLIQSYLFINVFGLKNANVMGLLNNILICQLQHNLYITGESNMSEKYYIGYNNECTIPCFEPFDTKEEADAFYTAVTTGNVDIAMSKNGKYCSMVWNGKNYKTSPSFDALNRCRKNMKTEMQIWSGKNNTDMNFGSPTLPINVNFMFDNFENVMIEKDILHNLIATCKKYRIGVHIIASTLGQIYQNYSDTIINSVDTIVFLNSIKTDFEKIQYLTGCSLNASELQKIFDDSKEIVSVRGYDTVICDKFNPENHIRYSLVDKAEEQSNYNQF